MLITGRLLFNNPSAIGDAVSEGASQFNQLNQAAANGDGRAMGNLVGMAATVFAGAAESPKGLQAAVQYLRKEFMRVRMQLRLERLTSANPGTFPSDYLIIRRRGNFHLEQKLRQLR